jgi:Ni,Fe-hydrogenase III large subunit/NADH:ubiquinone oxidoreductase subunit C
MQWAFTRNNHVLNLADIPQLDILTLKKEIINECRNQKRVIAFFGLKKSSTVELFVVLADDESSRLLVGKALFEKEKAYPSISPEVPSMHLFEREFYEEFGILPDGHPWLKPVRYGKERFDSSLRMEDYPFFTMKGEEIHEVAVGPIHAGIIEPGHFRFSCHGENVHHLEIQLGYQHRGIEKLFLEKEKNFLPHLAESIAGDSVIGHTTACVRALEALEDRKVSKRAHSIRAIALELERIAIHIGDLGALSGDIAYLMGNSVFGALRTEVINTSLALCGSRFGRGLIKTGGVLFDVDNDLANQMRKTLRKVYRDVERMAETMFSSANVLSRLEQTGIVPMEIAKEIGMVGPAARASGIPADIRTDHPYGVYRSFPFHKMTLQSGDVFARAYIRYVEIKQSIQYILEQLDNMYDEALFLRDSKKMKSSGFVVSLSEGWRGEIAHCIITGEKGEIARYKIKDPSFNNWYGLALAVRDNGISDFPLCNKSFNLSYCGHDL